MRRTGTGVEFAPHGARLVAYILDGIISGVVRAPDPRRVRGSRRSPDGPVDRQRRLVEVTSASTAGGRPDLRDAAASLAMLDRASCTSRSSGRAAARRSACSRSVCGSCAIATAAGSAGATAFLRLVGLYVAIGVMYLGFIWIFIDGRRRGWQDLIAGTIVIKRS